MTELPWLSRFCQTQFAGSLRSSVWLNHELRSHGVDWGAVSVQLAVYVPLMSTSGWSARKARCREYELGAIAIVCIQVRNEVPG